jgi:tetratricopeptide (TPR) repeat protein
MQSLDTLPIGLRLSNAPVAYVTYIRQAIWPLDLAALYPYPEAIPVWKSLGAALVLALATVAVLRQWRRAPYLAVGWGWFLGILAPVIGMLQVGAQPHADRFMHLPIVGLGLMTAWSASDLMAARPRFRHAIVAVATTLTLAWAGLALAQIATWRDGVTLWTHAVEVTTSNYRAQTNLGFAWAEAQEPERALAAYRRALAIKGDFPPARNYLGSLLNELGRYGEAEIELRQALAARPQFIHAHNNLGLTLVELGRVDEAIGHFEEALRLQASYTPARNNLGLAYLRAGRPAEAIALLDGAAREQPASAELQLNLATALTESGRAAEALAPLDRAEALGADAGRLRHVRGVALMELDRLPQAATELVDAIKAAPANALAYHDLGRVLLRLDRPDEARQMLERVTAMQPDSADAPYDLGVSLARLGRVADALVSVQRALALDPAHAEAREALAALRKR